MLNIFDIGTYIDAVSTYAADIDFLILLVAALVGGPFIIAELLLVGFALKFRKKEGVKAQYISGEEKDQKRWVTIPHYIVLLFDIVIIIFAVQVWVNVKQELPPADHTIRVDSQQWAWNFTHMGPDGKFDTADDIHTTNTLHVEVDKVYHFILTSKDVLHNFSVPAFRLKQDAIPGREIMGWFKAQKTGQHDIQCAEICGIGHGLMGAQIMIEDAPTHAAWQARRAGELAIAN